MQGVTYPCAYAGTRKCFAVTGWQEDVLIPAPFSNQPNRRTPMFDAFGLYRMNQAAAERKRLTVERIKDRIRERAKQADEAERKRLIQNKG